MPLVTKATRITYHPRTLIDHIYTNLPKKLINSGIFLADISDPLTNFCITSSKLPTQKHHKFLETFQNSINDNFLQDLGKIDFMSLLNPTDVNKSVHNIIESLQNVTNKQCINKKGSNSKKNTTWETVD